MWNLIKLIKLIFAVGIGSIIIYEFASIVFGASSFALFIYLISCFFWNTYCFNYYFPRKNNTIAPKKEDDDIDFKDLK